MITKLAQLCILVENFALGWKYEQKLAIRLERLIRLILNFCLNGMYLLVDILAMDQLKEKTYIMVTLRLFEHLLDLLTKLLQKNVLREDILIIKSL